MEFFRMSNFEYICLKRSDEEQIRRFYEIIPTSGDLHFFLNREPDFFDALEVEGDNPDVLVMRKIDSGEIIGSIIGSEKQCYINSGETSMGYISSLRLAEQYRNHLLGFFAKAFYQHQQKKGRKISLITIFEDNVIARKNLLSGKGSLPLMKDLGLIHTFIFKPLIISNKKTCKANIDIRFAQVSDISLIIDFFDKYGKVKTFFPLYKAIHFNSEQGILRNLKMKDIALAFDKSELIGVMGVWNQVEFRKWKIHTYSFRLNLLKPFINLYSWLNRKPLFPAAGKSIDYRNLALVCIKNNDQTIFNGLLKYHLNNLSVRKNVFIAYSMHESNPFLRNFPIPNTDLKSRLFLTYWKEDEDFVSSLRTGEVYLETGGL
jgi:hypothetical protein